MRSVTCCVLLISFAQIVVAATTSAPEFPNLAQMEPEQLRQSVAELYKQIQSLQSQLALSQKTLEVEKAYRKFYEDKFNIYDRHWQMNFYAWSISPQLTIPIEGRPQMGPPGAAHTLVIFGDFESVGCKQLAAYLRDHILPMSQKLQNGSLRVVFKHWPICTDCNNVMSGKTKNPKACQAAYAAEAARLVGGDSAFWKMHDLLFAEQDKWKITGEFVSYARQIGIDETAFKNALASQEVVSRVLQDIHDGNELGKSLTESASIDEAKVTGAPTIFIDGRRLTNPSKAMTWKSILTYKPQK